MKIIASNLHVARRSFWILYKTRPKQDCTFSYGRKRDENYARTVQTYDVLKANITLVISICTDFICTKYILYILCFVDPASRYIRVIKTNLMHNLSSVYFVNQPLHVSGVFVAHQQEVYCIYIYIYIYIYTYDNWYVLCFFIGRKLDESYALTMQTYEVLKANITLVISIWTDFMCTKYILYISCFVDRVSRYIKLVFITRMFFIFCQVSNVFRHTTRAIISASLLLFYVPVTVHRE